MGADWPQVRLDEFNNLVHQAEDLKTSPEISQNLLNQALVLAELQGDALRGIRVRLLAAKIAERSPDEEGNQRRQLINEFLDIFRLCTDLQDTACQAEALFHIGMGYGHFEDYAQATTYLLKALPRFSFLKDTSLMVQTCMRIGQYFEEQDLRTEAEEFSQRALVLAKASKSDSVQAWALRLVGRLHLARGEGEEALPYLEQARQLTERLLSDALLVELTLEAGEAALLQQSYPLAQAYFEKALKLSEQSEDSRSLIRTHLGMAEINRLKGLLPASLGNAETALKIAQQKGFTSLEKDALLELSVIYERMGEVEAADTYAREAEKIGSLLDQRRMQEQLQKIRNRYAVEEMEDRVRQASEQQALAEAELGRKRWQTGFALALGLSCMILALVLFQQYRQKQHANAWLETEVASRTQALYNANQRLQVLNEELDRLAYRTAHDVRGPLARVMGLAQVAADTDDMGTLQTYVEMLREEAEDMDHLLRQFMEVNHVKHLPKERDFISLRPMLIDLISHCRQWPGFAAFTSEIRCSEIQVKLHKKALETVLTQLLHNSLRFAHSKVPVCSIHATVLPEGLEILVIDNGQAVPEKMQPHLFEMFHKGSDPRSGLGLGLFIAKMAADHMGARLEYVPQTRPGSVFRLLLPEAEIQHMQETTERKVLLSGR